MLDSPGLFAPNRASIFDAQARARKGGRLVRGRVREGPVPARVREEGRPVGARERHGRGVGGVGSLSPTEKWSVSLSQDLTRTGEVGPGANGRARAAGCARPGASGRVRLHPRSARRGGDG